MMDKITYASATTLAAKIREKQLSAATVVAAHLQRIEAINPRLNALVQVGAERARQQAHAADDALRRGELWGPLHGVPFTVKDNIETEGIPCTCGTLGLADHVPTADAITVARIRQAGGILLGKTNLPELGMGYETDNLIYGRTNNPYDLTRTCGGSSGGEAALIAAGGSPLGLGTDGGGSSRWPAHCCGIAGIKPTTGRTPRIGHLPPPGGTINTIWQMGILARYVDDLALALPLICGVDSRDHTTVPIPFPDPQQVDLSALRVAVFSDNDIVSPSAEIADLVESCAMTLRVAGATVVATRPPLLEQTHDIYYHLMAASGGQGIQPFLEDWGTLEMHPYTIHSAHAQGRHGLTTAEFEGYLYQLDVFRGSLLRFMDEFDAILCPVSTMPAVAHGATYADQSHPGFATMFSYLMTFNLTGWPCGTVRAGTAAEGLPLGVQIAAAPWREDIVLAILKQLERVHGGWQPPPL